MSVAGRSSRGELKSLQSIVRRLRPEGRESSRPFHAQLTVSSCSVVGRLSRMGEKRSVPVTVSCVSERTVKSTALVLSPPQICRLVNERGRGTVQVICLTEVIEVSEFWRESVDRRCSVRC